MPQPLKSQRLGFGGFRRQHSNLTIGILIMVDDHSSLFQGALEEAANVDKLKAQWSGKMKQAIGKGYMLWGAPDTVAVLFVEW